MESLQNLIDERDSVVAEIDRLTKRKAEIDKELLGEYQPGDTLVGSAGPLFTVRKPSNRWSAEKAAEVLDREQQILISETVLSGEKAKAMLPPQLYLRCTTTSGKPTIARMSAKDKAAAVAAEE